jgi:hypothetical protein
MIEKEMQRRTKMKKVICIVLVVIALMTVNVLPSYAQWHGHGHDHGHFSFRGGVWIGPGWGPWWWGYPGYPYYYPYYPYYYPDYYEPPVVMEERTPAYSGQTPQGEDQNYWYFCPDSKNYYPYVKTCPKGWLKVVPHRTPPDWRE